MDHIPPIDDCREVLAPGRPGRRWFVSDASHLELVIWERDGQLSACQFSGQRGTKEWVLHWRAGDLHWQLSGVDEDQRDGPHHVASALLKPEAGVPLAHALDCFRAFLDCLPDAVRAAILAHVPTG